MSVETYLSNLRLNENIFLFLEKCLRDVFHELSEPRCISININIDGLPLFNNGADQVWPILFNVHEEPNFPPMIIGIFHGKTKPKRVEEFLKPFVDEALPIMNTGIIINDHQLIIKIRAFICDSPTRAFIKGTFKNPLSRTVKR